MSKSNLKGAVAKKTVTRKKQTNQLRANPALIRIMQKRIAEEEAERKKATKITELDVGYIHQQIDEILNDK